MFVLIVRKELLEVEPSWLTNKLQSKNILYSWKFNGKYSLEVNIVIQGNIRIQLMSR
jgi:hypothetical protein